MSPLPARMIKKKEVVLNSVAEFLGIWAVRGEASLSLNTKDGVTTIAFAHSFSGHPEDPLHPPPALTQRRRRHRGPARRERDRQRAARHQAAQMSQAGASPASPPSGATFQCDQCEKTFKTEPGLKIHTGKAHKGTQPHHHPTALGNIQAVRQPCPPPPSWTPAGRRSLRW